MVCEQCDCDRQEIKNFLLLLAGVVGIGGGAIGLIVLLASLAGG